MVDHVDKELLKRNAKSTLGWIQVQLMKTHAFKRFLQILGVVKSFDRFDQHVINISFHSHAYHLSNQLVHHPLVGSPNIDQVEGHDRIVLNITIII